MDFLDTVKRQLATRAYWDFRGRAGLPEFWLFMLFVLASNMAIGVIAWISGIGALPDFWSLFLTVPCLACATRRLHDSGHSMLILLIAAFTAIGAALFISRSLILAIYNPGAGMWQLLDDPNFATGLAFLAASALLLIMLLVLLILPSKEGENQYGTTFQGGGAS